MYTASISQYISQISPLLHSIASPAKRNQKVLLTVIIFSICASLTIISEYHDEVDFVQTNGPNNQIAFIKVHKSASSTVQNIFKNYGLRNNLSFAIPRRGGNILGWPKSFEPKMVSTISGDHVDILCYHARYSQAMRDYMPNTTRYITILRDPITQLESAVSYYKIEKLVKKSFERLILGKKVRYERGKIAQFTYNPQSYDLGLDHCDMRNANQVDEHIAKLDREFDLVLIAEYFDESLIILRDMLQFKNSDILYLRKNFRSPRNKNKISGIVAAEIRRWNSADVKLYNYFKLKLKRIIQSNVLYYQQQLKQFRNMTQRVRERCVAGVVKGSAIKDPRFKPSNAMGYKLTVTGEHDQQCINLGMAETPFVARIANYTKDRYRTI